jgi:hypothetical protein
LASPKVDSRQQKTIFLFQTVATSLLECVIEKNKKRARYSLVDATSLDLPLIGWMKISLEHSSASSDI